MIRKLRTGMMPPAGAKRPEGSGIADLAAALETRIDTAAQLNPNPGSRSFLRLNRAEYSRGDQGPARARHRRLGAAAGRHHQPRLRQRRRRADLLAGADGKLPARRRQGHRPGPRRSRRLRQRGALPRAQDRLAAAARRRRALRHARRPVGAPHLPGRRALHVPRRTARQRLRLPLRRAGAERAGRNLGRRRAQGGARHRSEDVRRLDQPHPENHRHPGLGRRAPRHRRVHAALRGPGQRPHRPHRPHPRRHADRRGLRHHHAAAPEGPGDCRPAARHRHLRHGQPPRGVHVPADVGPQRAGLRHRDRAARLHPGLPPAGEGRRVRRADGASTSRAARNATSTAASRPRSRPCWRARSSCSGSSRLPPRRRRAGPASPTGCATSTWRRACRSSCGASGRTRNW